MNVLFIVPSLRRAGAQTQIIDFVNALDCSFGFRPGRGCHDAILALHQHLYRNEVETVIDVDLASYFDSIDHALLLEMIGAKAKDKRFLRYLTRMFKAGVLAQGELRISDEGVPQGSLCSPILANIYAHYVIDVWFEETVKRQCGPGTATESGSVHQLVLCKAAYNACYTA